MSKRKLSINEDAWAALKEILARLNINPTNGRIESSASTGLANGYEIELDDQCIDSIHVIDEDTLERIDFFGGLLRCLQAKGYTEHNDKSSDIINGLYK